MVPTYVNFLQRQKVIQEGTLAQVKLLPSHHKVNGICFRKSGNSAWIKKHLISCAYLRCMIELTRQKRQSAYTLKSLISGPNRDTEAL